MNSHFALRISISSPPKVPTSSTNRTSFRNSLLFRAICALRLNILNHKLLRQNLLKGFLAIAILLSPLGCSKQESLPTPVSSSAPALSLDASALEAFTHHHLETVQKKLDSSTLAALLFNDSIKHFLAAPNAANLEAAQQKWQENYALFNDTSPFVILTDNAEQHSYIDSWPILPGYIDAISGFPNSGIVNDVTLELNEETLRQQHGLTFSGEVSTGFHAIEFMLWGETPTADNSESPKEAGEENQTRSLKRFTPVKHWAQTELDVSQHSNNRRRKYLALASRLLLKDIEESNAKAKAAWQTNPQAAQILHALYQQAGKLRSHLSHSNDNASNNSHQAITFSGAVHNDLFKHTRLILDLLKPLTLQKQALPEALNNSLTSAIADIESTLKELDTLPDDPGLWDRLDFNLSQLESFLFTTGNAFKASLSKKTDSSNDDNPSTKQP